MKKSALMIALLIFLANFSNVSPARAQAEPLLGQLAWFGFTFCPRGWAEANGQLLSIAQNSALFSLLGTTYGGDGRTTFALPDLRGRVLVHTGQGPGLSQHPLGEASGSENTTLTISQMPPHNHLIATSAAPAANSSPSGTFIASSGTFRTNLAPGASSLNPNSVSIAGSGQPFSQMQPYLVMRACIATEGVFPSRN